MFFKWHEETQVQFTEQPKRHIADEEFQYYNKDNAVQEHQRVAYEQVEIAAALATRRTAAQVTSICRDIKSNVEANFSHQQRGSLSESTSEPAQALEEATAEMMRRATRNQEVVSQSRSELMLNVNPMNFNSLKQCWDNFGAIKCRRHKARNLFEETRTANASVVPEVTRLQAREGHCPTESLQCEIKRRNCKDSCRISLRGTRINALMNQIWEYKQCHEHWKLGVGAPIADVSPRTQSLTDWGCLPANFGRAESICRKSRRRKSSTF